jgi:hypothetical protein
MNVETIGLSYLHKMFFGRNVRKPKTNFPNLVHSVTKTFALADVTAMHTTPAELIPALPNLKIRPVGIIIEASGTFNNFTNFVVEDGAGSPVNVATLTLAGVNAGLAVPSTAALTLGAGFTADLTVSKGVNVKTSGGTAAGTGTSITVTLLYSVTES